MPRHRLPSKSMAAAASLLFVVALPVGPVAPALASSGGSAATPVGAMPVGRESVWTLDEDLARARADSAAAEAALDAAKRVSTPGHLLDPLPASLMAGIGDLQAQYAEMQRKAAGYRATLGEQHPTLKGAEEVLAELRGQILDGARRATATAERDATRARGDVAALERRVRAAEATGSTGATAAKASVVAMPPPSSRDDLPSAEAAPVETARAAPARQPVETIVASGAALSRRLAGALPIVMRHLSAAAALGFVAAFAALWILAALLSPRRRRNPSIPAIRIEPAAPVEPRTMRAAAIDASGPAPSRTPDAAPPVLAVLPMAEGADAAAVAICLADEPSGPLAGAATAVVSTLAAAAGEDPRVCSTILVTPAAGAPDGHVDAAALAVACAAAAVGRRVLLAESRPDGRLGRALAAGAEPIATVAVDGQIRGVLRAVVSGRVLALLTGDPAGGAVARTAAHLPDLSGFDMIVLAGPPHPGSLLAADLVLLVAPCGADPGDLAGTARSQARDRNRPCGVLLVESSPVETAEELRQPGSVPQRRRIASDAAASRLGLRRTFEPTRRRA